MNMNRERLYANLAKRVSNDVGHRVDLALADARKINKTTAHVMLEFQQNVPTSEEIAEFFVRQFNAKLTPYLSTARVYESQKVVTVVAQILNVTREIEDIDRRKMVPVITGAVYLDVPLEETWEVVERNGKKVLCRKVKDDIMAIISARRNAMLDSNSKKTFASVAMGTGLLRYLSHLEEGDIVKALVGDKVEEVELMKLERDNVMVKMGEKSMSIPRQAVIEVVKRKAEMDESMRKATEEYFTKAYGDPGYAKKLVK